MEDGLILEVGTGADEGRGNRDGGMRVIDGGGAWLLPGMIDTHIHGIGGHEFMDATPGALEGMARTLVRHGVTSFLPTTSSASREAVLAALDRGADAMGPRSRVEGGAEILGVHVEGPYLNPAKCGAQDVSHIRLATQGEVLEILTHPATRMIALAPEMEGHLDVIATAVAHGRLAAIAHSDASLEVVQEAVRRGALVATHTYNAMGAFSHRVPGTIGAVLSEDAITCELIADGIHVHPAAMRILWKCKGIDRVILVSDAVSVAGMPDGTYTVHGHEVILAEGAVRLPDGTLSGSAVTLDRAVREFAAAVGLSPIEVWPTVGLNAARLLGLEGRKGSIQPGADADLVLLDSEYQVAATIVGGEVVYRANDAA